MGQIKLGRLELPFQLVLHLTWLGEATRVCLGEDELSIEGDLECSSRALHELGVDVEALLDLVCQTGSAGVVVSDNAIFNRQVRHFAPPPRIIDRTPGVAMPGGRQSLGRSTP